MFPAVTVVIPNFNHARFLPRRIETVLNQTYSNFELLYLDDASADNSNAVFIPYASDPRVRSMINHRNSGSPFIQWNRGVHNARGEYIWIAEADDVADPRLLEILVSKLEQDPDCVIAYCQSNEIDEDEVSGGSLERWTDDLAPGRWACDYVNCGKKECAEYMVVKNTIPNASAVVFRKDAYVRAGMATEQMRLCGDWLAWIRIAQLGKVAFVAEPLNGFRTHRGSVRSLTSAARFLDEAIRVQSFVCRTLNVGAHTRQEVARRLFAVWQDQVWCGKLPSLGSVPGTLWHAAQIEPGLPAPMLKSYLAKRAGSISSLLNILRLGRKVLSRK